jgi:hypothetical protein
MAAASVKSSGTLDADDVEETKFVESSSKNTVKSLVFTKKINSEIKPSLAQVSNKVTSFSKTLEVNYDKPSDTKEHSFIQTEDALKTNNGYNLQFGFAVIATLLVLF